MNDLIVEMNLRLKAKQAELKEVQSQIKMLEEFNRQKSRKNGRRGNSGARSSRYSSSPENSEDSGDDMYEEQTPKPKKQSVNHRRAHANNTNSNPLQFSTPTRDQLMMNNLTRLILGGR